MNSLGTRNCNYCELQRLKKFAAVKGDDVVVKPAPKEGFPNGIDAFLIDNERGEGEIWMLWMAELSEQCAC